MLTETITWRKADDPPDDDITVLVQFGELEVWPGYTLGGLWYDVDGRELVDVKMWAHVPTGEQTE